MILKKSILVIIFSLLFLGCKKSPAKKSDPISSLPGTWKQLSDFSGGGRARAFGFTIGNKGYIVGGHTGQSSTFKYLNDFWEYDPSTGKWTRRADYPGQGSECVVGFSINGKGYVGTGSGRKGVFGENRDFYQYDPIADSWTRKADFGGVERERAVAFAVNGMGYIGLGSDFDFEASYKDFWKYDPTTDNWTQVADYPGGGYVEASAFVCNGMGYVGLGVSPVDNTITNDFWQFDPSTNKWIQKANFIGDTRAGATQFVIGANGFVGFGYGQGKEYKDFWKYDSLTDTWSRITDFPGVAREELVGFAINNVGFIGTGNSGEFADFWEFTP